jgi:pre-rRNA-processing protein TSR1
MDQVRHNPGVFKQPNKVHKTGRHRSKGEVSRANNGKVDSQAISRKKKDLISKDQRKNRMFQMRKNKRDEIVSKKRCIGSLTGSPHIVSIIPLCGDVSCLDIMEVLNKCDSQAVIKITETSFYSLE